MLFSCNYCKNLEDANLYRFYIIFILRKGEKNMGIRKIHSLIGLIFAPFFIITSLTGIVLLWRKAGVYEKETKNFLLGMHNWEIASSYIGVILAFSLLFMTISGLVIFFKSRRTRK